MGKLIWFVGLACFKHSEALRGLLSFAGYDKTGDYSQIKINYKQQDLQPLFSPVVTPGKFLLKNHNPLLRQIYTIAASNILQYICKQVLSIVFYIGSYRSKCSPPTKLLRKCANALTWVVIAHMHVLSQVRAFTTCARVYVHGSS